MPSLLTAKNFKLQPWKNGGGLTKEIYRIPHGTDPDRFLFRLSIASVTIPGPFSIFVGIDRTLLLLSKRGMRLEFENGRKEVLERPFDAVSFKGEDVINCSLLGDSARDFNVMTDRDSASAKLNIVKTSPGQKLQIQEVHPLFIYQVEGEALLEEEEVNPDTLWVLSPDERVNIASKTECSFIIVQFISK